MRDILILLQRSDEPQKDQTDFFKSQILFWLIGATDGHAKNFSIFLRPEGRYGLTPFYDVLSAQPAFDKKQIPHNKYKLAMSAGRNRHYAIPQIMGHHFVQSGEAAGLGGTLIRKSIESILDKAGSAADRARCAMPDDFAHDIHESLAAAIAMRLPHLARALDEL